MIGAEPSADPQADRVELPTAGASPHAHVVALAGPPNTGKSTVFNALTRLRQRTGNWAGVTVSLAEGTAAWGGRRYRVIDLPGAYSLIAAGTDERIARDFVAFGDADVVVVVVDTTALERNLAFVLQILEVTSSVIVCLNMADEIGPLGLSVDADALSHELGVPAVLTVARNGSGIADLRTAIESIASGRVQPTPRRVTYGPEPERAIGELATAIEARAPIVGNPRWLATQLLGGDETAWRRASAGHDATDELLAQARALRSSRPTLAPDLAEAVYAEVGRIVSRVVQHTPRQGLRMADRVDRLTTSRWLGLPLMLALLVAIMWVTIIGANHPSQWLAAALFWGEDRLHELMVWAAAPWWLDGALVSGIYRGLAWVVSVMLPPMAIFFPLFTLLEDAGYLPRAAFNLDRLFARVGGSGQQALTMSMGFGCNAAGVIACRTIRSPRERLVAILTNNFVPCNGRWPIIILLSSLFIATAFPPHLGAVIGALTVVAAMGLGVLATLLVAGALTRTVLKGEPSAFVLELPRYRMPRLLPVIYRSVYERTLRVLGRAVLMAAPAGLIIWIAGNVVVGSDSLMTHAARALDGPGWIVGLDGVILIGFILAIPANEIVLPTILMAYAGAPAMLDAEEFLGMRPFFESQGWTLLTVFSVLIFVVLHNPCSTTLLTIWSETGSWRWTAAGFALPLALGLGMLAVLVLVVRALGGA